jgi:intein-encoded DNA endonuclease-like protein
LTDVNDKVIYSITTGMVTQIKNLKVSRSQDILEKMIKNIKDKLNFIKIRNLEIVFKSKCK